MTTTTHAATDIGATPDTGETDYEVCTLDIGGMTCAVVRRPHREVSPQA